MAIRAIYSFAFCRMVNFKLLDLSEAFSYRKVF